MAIKPLTGVRILDFTRFLSGPYGTMLLAAGTGSVLLLRKRHNSDE